MLLEGRDSGLREQLIALLQDPEIVNLLHNSSDFADTPEGLHHSLGLRHTQASYGDHDHDGIDSHGVSQLIASNGNGTKVTWDGSIFSVNNWVTVTTPGDLRLNRSDASPGFVTSGGFGGLRGFFIPGSTEQSFSITPAGIITMGNGSTTTGGSVNIRNPSAAALTQRTLTVQLVGSQTGDAISVIDSTNTNVLWRVLPSGQMNAPAILIQNGATGTTPAIINAPTGISVDVADYQINGITLLAVDKGGHLCGRGTGPTIAAGAALGTTPPAPVLNRGNDQAGRVTFGTGTATAVGVICTITYNRAYVTSNQVHVQQDAGAPALDLYCSNAAAGVATISCRTAPTASQAANSYGFTYQVIGN